MKEKTRAMNTTNIHDQVNVPSTNTGSEHRSSSRLYRSSYNVDDESVTVFVSIDGSEHDMNKIEVSNSRKHGEYADGDHHINYEDYEDFDHDGHDDLDYHESTEAHAPGKESKLPVTYGNPRRKTSVKLSRIPMSASSLSSGGMSLLSDKDNQDDDDNNSKTNINQLDSSKSIPRVRKKVQPTISDELPGETVGVSQQSIVDKTRMKQPPFPTEPQESGQSTLESKKPPPPSQGNLEVLPKKPPPMSSTALSSSSLSVTESALTAEQTLMQDPTSDVPRKKPPPTSVPKKKTPPGYSSTSTSAALSSPHIEPPVSESHVPSRTGRINAVTDGKDAQAANVGHEFMNDNSRLLQSLRHDTSMEGGTETIMEESEANILTERQMAVAKRTRERRQQLIVDEMRKRQVQQAMQGGSTKALVEQVAIPLHFDNPGGSTRSTNGVGGLGYNAMPHGYVDSKHHFLNPNGASHILYSPKDAAMLRKHQQEQQRQFLQRLTATNSKHPLQPHHQFDDRSMSSRSGQQRSIGSMALSMPPTRTYPVDPALRAMESRILANSAAAALASSSSSMRSIQRNSISGDPYIGAFDSALGGRSSSSVHSSHMFRDTYGDHSIHNVRNRIFTSDQSTTTDISQNDNRSTEVVLRGHQRIALDQHLLDDDSNLAIAIALYDDDVEDEDPALHSSLNTSHSRMDQGNIPGATPDVFNEGPTNHGDSHNQNNNTEAFDPVNLPAAVQFQPEQYKAIRDVNNLFFIILVPCAISIIVIVGVTLGSVIRGAISDPPIIDKGAEYRNSAQFIVDQFPGYINLADLHSASASAFGMAFDWLLFNDSLNTASQDDSSFLQRFTLASLYFSTSVLHPWHYCNPISDQRYHNLPKKHSDCHTSALSEDELTTTSNNTVHWLSPSHECTWAGIECDSRNHVTAIRLSDMGLSGQFPAFISNLPFLIQVELSMGTLDGPFPVDLFKLKHITKLEMHRNFLSGKLPNALSKVRNLQIINLSTNKITGAIPSDIGDIHELRYVDLSFNDLDGHLPSSIIMLHALSSLILTQNTLSGTIPPRLLALERLTRLDLAKNLISGSIPFTINALNLTQLNLGVNRLSGRIPESLYECSLLNTLELSVNNFIGKVSTNIGKLSNLQTLKLDNNQLTGTIPTEVGSITESLIDVSLMNNNFIGTIPQQLCVNTNAGLVHIDADCLPSYITNEPEQIFCSDDCCTVCCNPDGSDCRSM